MVMLKAGAVARTGLLVSLLFFAAHANAMLMTGTPPTTATVGQAYTFTPGLKGANACTNCFFFTNLPSWLKYNRNTGQIYGTPTATGSWSNIRLTYWNGVDGGAIPAFALTASAPATLKISGTPSSAATVAQFYSFKPTVTAAAGSTLTYAITNKPSWATFSTATGTLSGTPASANVATFSNILISVSNGKTSTSLPAFSIRVSQTAATGVAVLTWVKPTKNSDGTPLTNLAGFHVRYGTSTSALTNLITIGSPTATSASIENLNRGSWYFVMSSYTTAGVEGAPATAVSKTIQ